MARARAQVDEVPAGFAEEVERAVRAGGALALGKVKPPRVALSRRAQGLLFDVLARRGLERTARAVRVPLREQLAALLARGEPVATAGLRKHLKGVASAAELKLVIADLVRARRAALVMRSGKEHIAAPSGALMAGDEIAQVVAAARALARVAASTRSRAGQPPRTLLRAEVLALLAPLRGLHSPAAAAADDAAADDDDDIGDPVGLVVAAARGQTNPTTGLAFVPEVARALDGRLEGEALRAALVSAARSGLVELRPESGIELLSPAEAASCPRGPDGSPLSWLRVVSAEDHRGQP